MKQEIINWLESPRDYSTGVDLYLKYGKNNNFKRTFPNRENRYANKLAYELAKLAGISLVEYHKNYQKRVFQPVAVGSKKQIPEIIKKIKSELADLHRLRSHLHRKMTEIDPENSPDNMLKRKVLLSDIKKISSRSDLLYEAKESYFNNGILPDSSILLLPTKDKTLTPPNALSGEDRIKRRANLRSSLSKDKRKIEGMPDGPKKEKILTRLAIKEKEIQELNKLIDES